MRLEYPPKWCIYSAGVAGATVLCTPYNHAPCHFMQSHIRKVYACLAVTCHLRFWRNDWGLLRATVVTRGWNGYWNKSQHGKLTLEKKILPPFQQDIYMWIGILCVTLCFISENSNGWIQQCAVPEYYSTETEQSTQFWDQCQVMHSVMVSSRN